MAHLRPPSFAFRFKEQLQQSLCKIFEIFTLFALRFTGTSAGSNRGSSGTKAAEHGKLHKCIHVDRKAILEPAKKSMRVQRPNHPMYCLLRMSSRCGRVAAIRKPHVEMHAPRLDTRETSIVHSTILPQIQVRH
eukprot:6190358-Pleurochrysis_carterae.AAC.2